MLKKSKQPKVNNFHRGQQVIWHKREEMEFVAFIAKFRDDTHVDLFVLRDDTNFVRNVPTESLSPLEY